MRKAHRAILDLLHRHGFSVLNSSSGIEGSEVLLLFEFDVFRLPKVEVHDAPPVSVKNAEDFLRKWRASKRRVAGPYIRGERWVVDVRREAQDAVTLLKHQLRTLSLGRDLDRGRKGLRVLLDAGAVTKARAGAVTAFFDKRFPWER